VGAREAVWRNVSFFVKPVSEKVEASAILAKQQFSLVKYKLSKTASQALFVFSFFPEDVIVV
jgi:hypothetical protein